MFKTIFNAISELFGKFTILVTNIGMLITVLLLPVMLVHLVQSILRYQDYVGALVISLVIILSIHINKELQGGR